MSEQIVIVNILNNADQAIQAEKLQLSKLFRLKAGLMQDLLTGRVRVGQLVEEVA